MRCQIADKSSPVTVIAWQTRESRSAEPAVAGPDTPSASRPEPSNAEVIALQERLVQLEKAWEAERIRIRDAAFQDGMRQGREQAAGEVKAASERFGLMLRDLASLRRKIRNEAELDVVKLALAIARRVLHRELSVDPEALQALVHAALDKLQNREISGIRVHPACAGAVRSALEANSSAPAIEIFADSTLKNGDLIFEISLGDLDASVETQLQEIQRGFADRLSLR